MNGKEAITKILKREDPGRFVYAPNYWQWITHRFNQDNMPEDKSGCTGQLELIQSENLDVFSRNIYCDPYSCWFGGLSEKVYDGVSVETEKKMNGNDQETSISYIMKEGTLKEKFRYIHTESTLVQDKFLIDDFESQLPLLEKLIERTSWRFSEEMFKQWEQKCGNSGYTVAGEFFSPLKMLHLYLGPVETTFLLNDEEQTAKRLMNIHEQHQLELVEQMVKKGVKVLMSMDNLDSMFHPPHYVESYSASFYEKASSICHENDSLFFIHACGQQRANLKLISGLGVDGLEGVAFPPLGDVALEKAMEMTRNDFIITGGISANETTQLRTKKEIYAYVENLLDQMRPYRHRFMLSASCNTAIDTSWTVLKYFHQAWKDYCTTERSQSR